MYIIVGLGNPGDKYEKTRHNTGFRALDVIAGRAGIYFNESKHKAVYGKGVYGDEKVILVKPQTYMNLSGESVSDIVNYYKLNEKTNLIVIYDDISLAPGHIRIRKKGSAGGHNGIKNIIAQLGHDIFVRVKVGVGEKPAGYDLADYVLGHFSKEDEAVMAETFERAADAVLSIINDGPDAAMNHFNS